MKGIFIFIFLLAVGVPAVWASEVGVDSLEVGDGSITKVTSTVEAKLENRGFSKVFVALPQGWEPDEFQFSATGYNVYSDDAWRLYGLESSSHSLLGSGKAYNYDYTVTKISTTVGNRVGWWVMPNEGLILDIKVTLPTSGGVVDPNKIEEENPSIKMIKWKQEFVLDVGTPGKITAPWRVKNANITSISPPPKSLNGKLGDQYHKVVYKETDDNEPNVPAWNEWFDMGNSLAFALKDTSLTDTNLDFVPVSKTKTLRPVWVIDDSKKIYYEYEWYSYKSVSGIDPIGGELSSVPSWFEWFDDY